MENRGGENNRRSNLPITSHIEEISGVENRNKCGEGEDDLGDHFFCSNMEAIRQRRLMIIISAAGTNTSSLNNFCNASDVRETIPIVEYTIVGKTLG